MNNYTTAVVYDRKKKANRNNDGLLEIRITANRKSYWISTGVRIYPKEWAGAVIKRPDAEALNERLGTMVRRVSEEISDCLKEHREIDLQAIKEKLFEVKKPARVEPDQFLNWVDAQKELLNVKDETRAHYSTLLLRLEEFGRIRQWEDLTTMMIYEWDSWLRNLKKEQSKADKQAGREPECISDATVHNYHKHLKAILNRAVKMGLIESSPYAKLQGEFSYHDPESTEFLTDEEMAAVESLHPMAGTQWATARDLFVFQMYTGLSYSDAQAFDIRDYRKETVGEGERWVHVGQRIKTGVPYVSQLLPPVVEILQRYGWEAPKMNNQKYNSCLKDIQRVLGIKTRMHSHLARHTFATWMLSNDVPIEHVAKMIGHKKIQQTMRYAKVRPQAVYDDFERVSAKFKK